MGDFDLDLRNAEEALEDGELGGRIELGVLDGSTDADEWIAAIEGGNALVLAVDGDMNELAAGFARDVKDLGGELVHFRGFLIVSPPGVEIDTGRL